MLLINLINFFNSHFPPPQKKINQSINKIINQKTIYHNFENCSSNEYFVSIVFLINKTIQEKRKYFSGNIYKKNLNILNKKKKKEKRIFN